MAKRWTKSEEERYRKELQNLYVINNKTIKEIGNMLQISEKTVFQRIKRLGIKSDPSKKQRYCNRRQNIYIPEYYTEDIAEFFGIMLGDGHISKSQALVTLGNKEYKYAMYVASLIEKIFKTPVKIATRAAGYNDVYLGSVEVVKWLKEQGLTHNKTQSQIDIPKWIFNNEKFIKKFLRGFFDTDGSIYKIKYGIQISFSNRSRPLLRSLHKLLLCLQYSPSNVSHYKVYLTKKSDVVKFIGEVQPKNAKHLKRYIEYKKCVGTQVVNEGGL